MKRRIGVHVSIAGGMDKGLERAKHLGCTTVQMFSHNPRGWALGKRQPEEIAQFRALKRVYDIHPAFIHTSYLINLASARPDLSERSMAMVEEELCIADQVGAEYVVLHTGSASGDDPAVARKRAVMALKRIAEKSFWNAGLLLENTAGERGDITSRVHELAEIMEQVTPGLIAGICIDTCHAFAAGYDISTEEGAGGLAAEIRRYCGRNMLKLVHLNDSKKPAGAGVDRHEHIGKGAIGDKSFRRFVNLPFFTGIPLVLETPKISDDDDRRNLETVRGYFKKAEI
ncbi:MAG: deoxyribonuclease IV [Nitrospirae bacterium]|nr:deoxyribonuclease IV [Nitrospirota bacterium]